MKYLVTGGAGFIGSNLALELEQLGHDVTVIDNFSTGNKKNLMDFKGRIVNEDISKSFGVHGRFDAIFHQAAITDPRYPDEAETVRQNVDGFKKIIEKAKKDNAKLIYASTASLYGNGPYPQKEDQEKEIISAYGRSKLLMDEIAENYLDTLHIIGLRYFNVYGPREDNKGGAASMIYHLSRSMRAGKAPRIFRAGEQKRDHIYVKDCVSANLKALTSKSGIFNVGTGVATSFNDLVALLNEVLGTELTPEYFDMPFDPKTYQVHTQASTSKAESILKFKACYSLKKGIEEYMKVIR
jgi:ADP-L-glycero-D-manno-heptose 6-epimerase